MTSSHTSSSVSVLLPLPLAGAYDYALADGQDLPADKAWPLGSFVRVPLGRRELVGVVWGPASGDVAATRLKPILAPLEAPPLGKPLRDFIDWVAAYTLAPPGAVLRMAMSAPDALGPRPPRIAYQVGGDEPERMPKRMPKRMTAARARVLAAAAEGPPRPAVELARAAGVGAGVVRGLARAGALEAVEIPAHAPFLEPDWRRPGPTLSAEQARAAEGLAAKVAANEYDVTLLDGVNGAGKTEVYFAAVAAALEAGRQTLVLLPEIALGAQWLARFHERFGVEPAQWHSEMTPAQRRRTWRAVAEGEARVVVGARSALFLPFPDLGLIVVDEEHDASFKQEEGVIYHARDMAVARARFEEALIVLASATPSLETVTNVATGRYERYHLPDRHGSAGLAAVAAIDMRKVSLPASRWLSPPLIEAVERSLARNEQAMLFLNRRGYAPLTLCRACGHRLGCPHCSTWLVEHRRPGELPDKLLCHHCGFAMRRPEVCPGCQAEDRFAACGPGVERLAEEACATFPEARLAVMASDTMTSPAGVADLVRRMAEREVDILIGTQIMAKGHHFPLLTLVGVIDGDLGLGGGDLRAAERTYQLLHQVAGRSGRAEHPGSVLLQTYMPDHPVMAALIANDREGFIAQETKDREARSLPPFGRLAALIVSGHDEAAALGLARDLARTAPRGGGIEVLGPAPAPLSLLRNRYRFRLLLKAARGVRVQAPVRAWLARVKIPRSLRVQVDIDPYSFL